MDFNNFKLLAHNTSNFSADEVDDFELMNGDELKEYQEDLEVDSGTLSAWDHMRAFFTMKAAIMGLSKMLTEVE